MDKDTYNNFLSKIQNNKSLEVIHELERNPVSNGSESDLVKIELLARSNLKQKHYQKSYDNFMQLVEAGYAFNRELVDEFAKSAVYLKKTKAAVNIYRTLIKTNPYDKTLLENIIRIGISAKDSEIILTYTAKAIAANQISQQLILYALDNLKGEANYDIILPFLSLLVVYLPNNISLWRNITIIYLKKGNYKKAEQSCKIAINLAKDQDLIAMKKLLGSIFLESKNLIKAKDIFIQLYQSDKRNIHIAKQLVQTLFYLREYNDLVKISKNFESAEILTDFNFLNVLIRAFHRLNKANEVDKLLDEFLTTNSLKETRNFERYLMLLLVLDREEIVIKTVLSKGQALSKLPKETFNYYISALMNLAKFDEVIKILTDKNNLNQNPNFENFRNRLQLCFAYLSCRNFNKGFELYESRKEITNSSKFLIKKQGIEWTGESIKDKTLLVTAEQGQGDIIMLARYFSELPKVAGRVIFEVQSSLLELLQYNFPEIKFLKRGSSLPNHNYYVHAMSLFKILKADPSAIPKTDGYLSWPNSNKVIDSHKLKVALSWQGSRLHPNDYLRSIPVNSLAPLYELKNKVQFISIQMEGADWELQDQSFAKSTIYLGSKIKSFSDTASIANSVDLLITCDSANGHLFGAMNKSSYTLLHRPNDWRWEGSSIDSYWYDSVKLFRIAKDGNTEKGWANVIADVKREIIKKLEKRQ